MSTFLTLMNQLNDLPLLLTYSQAVAASGLSEKAFDVAVAAGRIHKYDSEGRELYLRASVLFA